MQFATPQILWLLAATLPLLVWFLWWAWRKKQALVAQFVQGRLLPQLTVRLSLVRQKIRIALLVLAVVCAFLALARPQWGFKWEEAKTRGLDIVVAIDTSRSMLAPDIRPDRLTRAKLAALDLLRLAKSDRLGLVAFAGSAFLQCPLTLDDEAFRQSVALLEVNLIPQGGTAIAEAIQTALSAFKDEGDNYKVLVLFTDGEDHDSGALAAAEQAAKQGLLIYTVGVGTPEGELLQMTDESGKKSYVKDDAGNAVKSRLNESLLTQIATAANGFYLNLRGTTTIDTLYKHERGLGALPKSELATKLVQNFYERFQWPLAVAVVLLLAELFLPDRQRARRPEAEAAASDAGLRKAVTMLCLLALPFASRASTASARRSYENGNFQTAQKEYQRLLEKKPDDPRLHFNAGAAAYKNKDFEQAAKDFSSAVTSPDLPVQQRAYYNFGNALYRQGERASEPDEKSQHWQQAVQQYESALKLEPKDQDAQFNLELVKQKLAELRKEQSQSPPRSDQKDKSEEGKQDQQQDKQDQKGESEKDPQPKKDDQQEQKRADQDQQQEQQANQDQQQQEKSQAQKQGSEQDKSDAQEQADAAAAQLGQMTPQQAQQLLDSQKGEEKALIFRPADKAKGKGRVFKDW